VQGIADHEVRDASGGAGAARGQEKAPVASIADLPGVGVGEEGEGEVDELREGDGGRGGAVRRLGVVERPRVQGDDLHTGGIQRRASGRGAGCGGGSGRRGGRRCRRQRCGPGRPRSRGGGISPPGSRRERPAATPIRRCPEAPPARASRGDGEARVRVTDGEGEGSGAEETPLPTLPLANSAGLDGLLDIERAGPQLSTTT